MYIFACAGACECVCARVRMHTRIQLIECIYSLRMCAGGRHVDGALDLGANSTAVEESLHMCDMTHSYV